MLSAPLPSPRAAFRIDPRDDVAVALAPIAAGQSLDIDGERLRSFTAQAEENEIEAGLIAIEALVLGLKCGGSDGFSGLTANPWWARWPTGSRRRGEPRC